MTTFVTATVFAQLKEDGVTLFLSDPGAEEETGTRDEKSSFAINDNKAEMLLAKLVKESKLQIADKYYFPPAQLALFLECIVLLQQIYPIIMLNTNPELARQITLLNPHITFYPPTAQILESKDVQQQLELVKYYSNISLGHDTISIRLLCWMDPTRSASRIIWVRYAH